MGWMNEVNEFIEKHKAHPAFGPAIIQLEQAKNTLFNVAMHFAKVAAAGDTVYPMLHACPYLEMFGEVELAYLLLQQAVIAKEKLDAIFQKRRRDDGRGPGQSRSMRRRMPPSTAEKFTGRSFSQIISCPRYRARRRPF